MQCYSLDDAKKAFDPCPAIELFCKSAWTARRRTGTTSIADPEHGHEPAKVFSELERMGFECASRRPFQAMPRPRSSVNSSMTRRLRKKTESYAGSHCVVLPAEALQSLGLIWFRR